MLRGDPRPQSLLWLVLLGPLGGCDTNRPALVPLAGGDPLAGISLPGATSALPDSNADAPLVTVAGHEIRLDGARVGDATEILNSRRMSRLDGLFEALKSRRVAWNASHPAGTFSGEVLFAMADDTPAVLVKSVFQTAAFAGYPNPSFVVRTKDGLGRLPFEVWIPGPPTGTGDGLTDTQVRAVVKAHEGALRACYESEAPRDASLHGGVTAAWEIQADGAVRNVTTRASTLNNPRVEGCIVRQIASWTFPKQDRPTIIGAYPLRFGVAPDR